MGIEGSVYFPCFYPFILFFSAMAWEFQGVMFTTHVLYCSACVRNPVLERLTIGLGKTTALGAGWGSWGKKGQSMTCPNVLCCMRTWVQRAPCSTTKIDTHSLYHFPEGNFKLPETLLPLCINAQKCRKDTIQVRKPN